MPDLPLVDSHIGSLLLAMTGGLETESGYDAFVDNVASCGHIVRMKKKAPKRKVVYSEARDTAEQIKEDAAAYGLRRDVMGVREAKDQLSALLNRAADGEEIVITSDGAPKAMIVRYRPTLRGKAFLPNLELLRSMPMTADSTQEIREERDVGL